MGLKRVELLLQGDQPAGRQVDVLQENPSAVLGGRVDGLVRLGESFFGSDGDRSHAAAQLGGQVVDTSGRVESGHGTHQDRRAGLQFVVDNVRLVLNKSHCQIAL